MLNLDNLGALIKFEGVESIYTFETFIETFENSNFIKENWPNSDQNWPESLFCLSFRLLHYEIWSQLMKVELYKYKFDR